MVRILVWVGLLVVVWLEFRFWVGLYVCVLFWLEFRFCARFACCCCCCCFIGCCCCCVGCCCVAYLANNWTNNIGQIPTPLYLERGTFCFGLTLCLAVAFYFCLFWFYFFYYFYITFYCGGEVCVSVEYKTAWQTAAGI